jgi:hypothetical protein
MDCVAGRKTVGRITGDILVNGLPKQQATWARQIGYVEQMVRGCCCSGIWTVCMQTVVGVCVRQRWSLLSTPVIY